MANDFKNIEEVLNTYDIKVSIDDSIKSFINKIKHGLSKIEDSTLREEALTNIAKVLADRKYISRKALM